MVLLKSVIFDPQISLKSVSRMLYRKITSYQDYTVHSALNNLLKNPDYHVNISTVVSNERTFYLDGKTWYMPVYFIMFFDADTQYKDTSEYIF